jgi:hypothetical protein
MMKRLSCSGLSQIMKHGFTTESASSYQSMEWQNTSLPRSIPSSGKVILMLFWDFNGPVLNHYQDSRQKDNSAGYCAMLEEELKPATCSRPIGALTYGVVLHYNSA